jgi:hypothetical protein
MRKLVFAVIALTGCPPPRAAVDPAPTCCCELFYSKPATLFEIRSERSCFANDGRCVTDSACER